MRRGDTMPRVGRFWTLRRVLLALTLLVAGIGLAIRLTRGDPAERWMRTMRAKGEVFTLEELGLMRPPIPDPTREVLEVAAGRLTALDRAVTPGALEDSDTEFSSTRRIRWKDPALPSAMGRLLDWEKAAGVADELRPALAELHAALREPARDPGWDYTAPFIPNQVQQRRVAQFLSDLTEVELHRGNRAEAFADLITLVRLARLYEDNPTLVNQMIRSAILGLGTLTMWDTLQATGWTEPQLEAMQEELEHVRILPQFPRTCELERAGSLLNLDRYIRDGPASQSWRWQFTNQKPPAAWLADAAFAVWRVGRSGKDRWLILQLGQDVIERHRTLAAGVPYLKLGPPPEPPSSWWNNSPTAQNLFPLSQWSNLARATEVMLRNETGRRLAILAVAVERFRLREGRYPATVAELIPKFLKELAVDPISGQPLQYRLAPEGVFTLAADGFQAAGPGHWAENLASREPALVWPRAAGSKPQPAPEDVLPRVMFQEAPLADAIRMLARQAGVNLVFDPAVSARLLQRIDLRLENVTAREALESVLWRNGLRLEEIRRTRIHRVMPAWPAR